MIKIFFSKQFAQFLVAGSIAACVNFFVGFFLAGIFPFHGDVVVGYLAGMLTAFVLFETHVFGEDSKLAEDLPKKSRKKSVSLFFAVNALGLFQTWIIFAYLKDSFFPAVDFFWYPEILARIIAIGVPSLTSFLGHKYFTFKQ